MFFFVGKDRINKIERLLECSYEDIQFCKNEIGKIKEDLDILKRSANQIIETAKSSQEALVAELANVEGKQTKEIKTVAKQITEDNKENQERVVELFEVYDKRLKEQIADISTSVRGYIEERLNAMEEIALENHKAVLGGMELTNSLAKSSQEVLVAELANVEAKRTKEIKAVAKQIAEANKESQERVAIVNGFNNLNKMSNEIVNKISKLDKDTVEQLMQIDESIRLLLINNLMDDLEKCGNHKK